MDRDTADRISDQFTLACMQACPDSITEAESADGLTDRIRASNRPGCPSKVASISAPVVIISLPLDQVLGGSVVTVDHDRALEARNGADASSPDAHVIVCGNRLPSLRN